MFADEAVLCQAMQRELHEQYLGRRILIAVQAVHQVCQAGYIFKSGFELVLREIVQQINGIALAKPVRYFFVWAFFLLLAELVGIGEVVYKLRAYGFAYKILRHYARAFLLPFVYQLHLAGYCRHHAHKVCYAYEGASSHCL